MPTVLLITEQDRVRRLFAEMEQEGLFRLRLAPTLGQGEEEIAVRLPHYVFVENGISGLSAASIAHHLRSLLPEGAEVVLMARGATDNDECREVGGLFLLELSKTDEVLRSCIAEMIPRYTPRENPLPTEPVPALPKTAREFLSHEPDAGFSDKNRYLIWLIPLAIALISLGVIAYRARMVTPPAAPVKPAAALPRTSAHSRTYVVQSGDNLLRVMIRQYGYTYPEAVAIIPELKRLNKVSNLDLIQPGQTIIIPARESGIQAE